MNEQRIVPARRRPRLLLAGAVVAFSMVVAACGASAPTPIYIVITPTPAPPATPTPTPSPTPEPTPTPELTATPTAAPTATPAPTTAGTATPAGSPTPTASVAPGANCTGAVNNAGNLAFWTGTANHEPFAVYCGVLPSPWYFTGANSSWGTSGLVTAQYSTKAGGAVYVQEGRVKSTFCTATTGSSGTAKFASFGGTVYTISGGFALCTTSGGYGYEIKGIDLGEPAFVQIAAAMTLVPKS